MNSASAKRSNKSQQTEGLIGEPTSKERSVIIMSKKSVEESVGDIATLQKKIIMKDLISVLKDDSRLAHKPLVYQLQNNWELLRVGEHVYICRGIETSKMSV